jgi:hypothetical protein
MTHLAPKDSDDEASHEDVGGGDSFVVEPSLAKKLLLKVKKNFCLQLSIQERQYEAHCNEKYAHRRQKAIMRQLSLSVSKGSKDSITPKEKWIFEHSEWHEDPLEPSFDSSPSGQHDGEWAS